MTRRESYLDWNATAPLRPEAAAAIVAALGHCGNPSSVHRWGRAARQVVECAREAVAALIGADPEGVIFVSGGTEANHLAPLGSGRERILVSAVEHNSVLQAVPAAERIAVDADGIVDLADLDRRLAADPRPALVSVMLANNETGIGALIVGSGTDLRPMIRGGGQERGRRAGSENLPGIAGFAAAATAASERIADYDQVRQLRRKFEAAVAEIA